MSAEIEETEQTNRNHDEESDQLGAGHAENPVGMVAAETFQHETENTVGNEIERRDPAGSADFTEQKQQGQSDQQVSCRFKDLIGIEWMSV